MRWLLTLALAGYSLTSLAWEKRMVLQYYDLQTNNQLTLFLNEKIAEDFPGVNPADYQLEKVRLTAKSFDGQATAYLQIGSTNTENKVIEGIPQDINNQEEYTFDNKDFTPAQDLQGEWSLHLNGKLVVRRVAVYVTMRNDCRYYLYWPHFYWGTRAVNSTIEGAVWNQNQGQGAVCGNGHMTSCTAGGYLYWRGQYFGDERMRYQICRKKI